MGRLNELWLLAWERDYWDVYGAVQLEVIILCLSQPVQYGQCNGAIRHLAQNKQEEILFHTAFNRAQELIATGCVRCKSRNANWMDLKNQGHWEQTLAQSSLKHLLAGNISCGQQGSLCAMLLAETTADGHSQTLATGMNGPLVWPKYLKIFMLIAIPSDIWS